MRVRVGARARVAFFWFVALGVRESANVENTTTVTTEREEEGMNVWGRGQSFAAGLSRLGGAMFPADVTRLWLLWASGE